MSEILIRKEGLAGRITLNRPEALNAVTWDMIRKIAKALADWEDDDQVRLVVIDAAGDRAFAAGGDIVDLYRKSRAGDLTFGRRFWTEEYRLNIAIAEYPKPVVTLMQGFTMGGGVGLACHASHRIVDEGVQIAMPECAIGLIPDVGGSHLLANAPGSVGVFLGLTGHRMGPGDAIFSGFADSYVPRTVWPDLIERLEQSGDVAAIDAVAMAPPDGTLATTPETSAWFQGTSVPEILETLAESGTELGAQWIKTLRRQSPLAVVTALDAVQAARTMTLREAIAQEFRYVWRAVEDSDFLEGIRAAVIDKDRTPHWKHESIEAVPVDEARAMLMPLGENELNLEETP